jgi:preprotein translocase subunit SecE
MSVKEKPQRTEGSKRAPGRGVRAAGFIREVRSELRKVVWPSRPQAINLTMVVIAVSAAVGVFLGLVDFVFSQIMEAILR